MRWRDCDKIAFVAEIRDVAVDLCHRPLLVATRSMKVRDFGSVYLNASGKSCFMDLERSSSSLKKLHRRIETEAAPQTFSPRTPLARSPIRKSSQFTSALVIFLGNYCDCGPETRKVIDFLISLPEKHRSKPTSFSPLTRARIKPVSSLETAPTSSSSSDVVDLASLEQSMESFGLGKLTLSIGRACLVKKQELYAMKFASLAEFGDESIEVFLIFPRHITFAKIARSLGSRRELLIGT
ncbi:hypothetical protein DY000_02039310 [Brassica cretica]|uniref:Uncharacterized protein n=1 Tax=Brassica cretica TaxID=69181 RepID=A0ABQ7BAH3_BRACR|nr:hypothetical protein DY000_02039310 [Brassica cretica]